MKRQAVAAAVLLGALARLACAQAAQELIEESLRRHAQPAHVYEEQAWVMTDRQGKQTVRTLRSYSLDDEGGSRNLRVIETPLEAKGTALYVERDAQGREQQGGPATRTVFGSNFTLADLAPEQPGDFRYEREGDQVIDRVLHYVLRALPRDDSVTRRSGYHERRIYLRKDNLFVSRIEYRNASGLPVRRQTFRDPVPDDSGAWRPRMILMEDLRDGERTLVKVERRVHSPDYVPATVFTGFRTRP